MTERKRKYFVWYAGTEDSNTKLLVSWGVCLTGLCHRKLKELFKLRAVLMCELLEVAISALIFLRTLPQLFFDPLAQ